MRILLMGFIVFVGWSAFSAYIYVCKVKGLCPRAQTTLFEKTTQNEVKEMAPVAQEQDVVPKDLIIYFAFDKSNFLSGAEASEYFDKSSAYLFKNSQATLIISGHTDAVGTVEYNQALGLRRALAVQQYFKSKGLHSKRISIVSKGEKEPVEDNITSENRAKNRRTVVTIK